MSTPVIASHRVRRRRLVMLGDRPGALDGVFADGAEVVGHPAGPATSPMLITAEAVAALDVPIVAVVPSHAPAPLPDWQRSERYTVAPRRLAELVARVRSDTGAVPRWLQHLVFDDVLAYLRADSGLYTVTADLPADVTEAFHEVLGTLMGAVDDEVITGFTRRGATVEHRLALLLGAQGRTGHLAPRVRRDPGRGLQRVSYLYAGRAPDERHLVDGRAVVPLHAKTRAVDVLGRTLLRERIAWLPEHAQVEIDPAGEVALLPARAAGRTARYRRVLTENSGVARRVLGDARTARQARGAAARERYRDAWLLMDRDTAAQDNAEHLYRHLRAHEPDVNAWFVLGARSPDWDRLNAEGFRLLAYGSREHLVALLNCAHLISSQVDSYVVKPFRKHALGPGHWRYTFLQHGVIKDDLSRWLNEKPMDLFITSTPNEQRSIVGDDSPYVFTDLETVMTGLARHDRLLGLAGTRERTHLLVMPTWRRDLLGANDTGNRRELVENFWTSGYARAWRAVLESPVLRELCEQHGWQLTFVPHPNMQDYVDDSPLPAHVTALRFDSVDVQELLAGAAVVISDYSSLATEAAYIERPVVYYQFDRAEFFAGGHVYRRGAWSYERDGFGPVTETADAAVAAVVAIARDGLDPVYAERMRATFPLRDGRCCARTVTAIRAIDAAAPVQPS